MANLEDVVALTNCYVMNCNKEYLKRKELRTKWFEDTEKLHQEYKKGDITRKQVIAKLKKLDNKYFSAIENINLHKCELDKCEEFVIKRLDYLSERNKLKKKDKYTINDYVKILKTNNRNFNQPP